jgi:hypothetical protein
MEPCLCGDTQCPICGFLQGTLEDEVEEVPAIPKMKKQILDDKREIKLLFLDDNRTFWVGLNGVNFIDAYPEPGQYARQPWFAIHMVGEAEPRIRVNGAFVVELHYGDDT